MPSVPSKKVHGDPMADPGSHGSPFAPLTRPTWLWLAVIVTGLGLFLVSRQNYLLFHTLVETSSIALALAVFLVGWNTRYLLHAPLFLILATGFLGVGFIDLLHMLAYKGMGVFPNIASDLPTQFWVAARYLNAVTFLLAAFSVRRAWRKHGWRWLLGFSFTTAVLVVMIWPLGIFPACLVEPDGLTRFKIVSEYLVSAIMAWAGWLFWHSRQHLSRRLVHFLLLAVMLNILSEFSFTLYHDVYGYMNFLGHYLKMVTTILVYAALVEGTLRDPYSTLFRELAQSNRAFAQELQKRHSSEEEKRIVNQEFSLLYRLARVFYRTLQLDALTHLILSAATSPQGGGFYRAMLFTVNERTRMIQGMLGIDQQTSRLILPVENDFSAWENPVLDRELLEAQRVTEFNRTVIKQRLSLDAGDNVLAEAFLERKVMVVPSILQQEASMHRLSDMLTLGPAACVPLVGRHQSLGVLLVDMPRGSGAFSAERLRFLELFARQAAAAIENAELVQRLESAHEDLRNVQERLIEGEKLAVLGEMAAQVAHELKNPLVSIGGFAQRLKKMELGDVKANEYAAIIAREVRRLEEMLANILAFSKKQLVCLETCDMVELVEEALALEREHCQRQSIEIDVGIVDGLPLVVGDCQQLRQVLLNLMINARQAMSKGGTMNLRLYKGLLRGDEAVILEVEDTGGGIAPEIMRNIFNPFFSTHAKGTGLGLSISHRVVEQHRGVIDVINRESGACFIVRLPVNPPALARH